MFIEKKTSNSCEFYFDITEVENTEVKVVEVQVMEVRLQGCGWQKNRYSRLSNSGRKDLVLEINDLKSGITYDVRAVFKCGGSYCLSEHFGLKIIGKFNFVFKADTLLYLIT